MSTKRKQNPKLGGAKSKCDRNISLGCAQNIVKGVDKTNKAVIELLCVHGK